MNPVIHPYPFREFPMECLIYLMFVGRLHLIVGIVGSLIVAALNFRRRKVIAIRIVRFNLFNALMLVIGALFNGLWSCLIWGRFYYSTDYVFDFPPFWPITQWVIDAPFGDVHGQLFGITLWELQLIWLLFAAGTWGLTILCYRLIVRRKVKQVVAVKLPVKA